jgi:hypothetical protein
MPEAILAGEPDEAEKKIEEDTITDTEWLLNFLNGFMYTVMVQSWERVLKKWERKRYEFQTPPKDAEIELPYFIIQRR